MNARLQDIEVVLDNRPGSLADFGQVLGGAGVSLDGGGVFTHDAIAVAHFQVDDALTAREALEHAGIGPVRIRDVVMLKLDQNVPGRLGLFARRLGEAGVNIIAQYSDHDHNLVIVTEEAQYAECARVAAEWNAARDARRG